MPLTILVAEDDEGTRLSISDYLELEGYSVLLATDGEDAFRQIFAFQPHLLITDITMPHVDGYELVQRVRQHPAWRLLPVIFLSAHTETENRIKGYQMGCDAYLPKPFELGEIGAVVRNLLERSQLIQAAWINQVALQTAQDRAMASERAKLGHSEEEPKPDLTSREQDVLTLISDGLSNAQIGDRLYLSPRTVEKYVSSLFRKTDTNNRAELVRFAVDHHMVK
ncbi:MAG: response regulator transcription factor [Cyanobacteria bacterium Co-bin13]|nr:response regulator transcription factor [Cyanobacteria bacterium Co-bin13]